MSSPAENSEHKRQRDLLCLSVGKPGSGAARYAAAMYFFNARMMSAEMLEIYRMCSKFDNEDPIDLARYEGVRIAPDFPGLKSECGT